MTSPEGSRLGVLIRQLQGQGTELDAAVADLDTTVADVIGDLATPREGAGRKSGTDPNWSASFNGYPLTFTDSDASPIWLHCTPTVNSWWPVHGGVLVRTLDAAWAVMNVDLYLTPADANGQNAATFAVMHHGTAAPHVSASTTAQWALNAGVAYTCVLRCGYLSGNFWQYYYGGAQHTRILSPGSSPR